MSDAHDEATVFGDRYRLVRHIARGGMAQVYLAQDTLLDRPVALKVLFPELSVDEAFVHRFRREARSAANLTHPNIVSIYDWGQGTQTYFIVMEYVDGETLSARIRRGPMAPDQAAIVAIATSGALSFAHRRQVIHRDVKPGNVLIDRSGQVKVADFGIARAVGTTEDLTQAGAVMGTATYFSPEQAQGQAVDARSDVYSLGVVLYEMVAGRPPFRGDNPVAIAYKHVRENPPPLLEANPHVPPAFAAIVATAMAKSPEDRYQTADALRVDLERFRAGQPLVTAAVDGAGEPTRLTLPGSGASGATAILGPPGAVATRLQPAVDAPTVTRSQYLETAPNGSVPPDPPERTRWGLWAALVILLLAALAVSAYFIGRDLGIRGAARTAAVPSVSGTRPATAQSRLERAGFRHLRDRYLTSGSVPKGEVIGTEPRAGTRLAVNRTVVIEVSKGRATVALPDVAGETQSKATAQLRADRFVVVKSFANSSSVHQGVVITTRPAGPSNQARGSTVTLVISLGPRLVAVPDVTGDNQTAATDQLHLKGFQVNPTPVTVTSNIKNGDVVRTSPGAGNDEPVGTPITLYVSGGPAQVTTPYLLGDTAQQAKSVLRSDHLKVAFANQAVSSSSQNGLVQQTSPPGGVTEPTGTTVTVYVGVYTPPSSTSPSSTSPSSTAPGTSGVSGGTGVSGGSGVSGTKGKG